MIERGGSGCTETETPGLGNGYFARCGEVVSACERRRRESCVRVYFWRQRKKTNVLSVG